MLVEVLLGALPVLEGGVHGVTGGETLPELARLPGTMKGGEGGRGVLQTVGIDLVQPAVDGPAARLAQEGKETGSVDPEKEVEQHGIDPGRVPEVPAEPLGQRAAEEMADQVAGAGLEGEAGHGRQRRFREGPALRDR